MVNFREYILKIALIRSIFSPKCKNLNPRGITVNPNLNRNPDLWPFNPKTYHLYDIPRSFSTPILNTLGSFVFELCSRHQCEKCTYWPSDLDLWPLDLKTVSLLGYPKTIPWTNFERFGFIRFWVMLRTNKQTNKQTDRQTDRQTTSNVLPTPTDIFGVRN